MISTDAHARPAGLFDPFFLPTRALYNLAASCHRTAEKRATSRSLFASASAFLRGKAAIIEPRYTRSHRTDVRPRCFAILCFFIRTYVHTVTRPDHRRIRMCLFRSSAYSPSFSFSLSFSAIHPPVCLSLVWLHAQTT